MCNLWLLGVWPLAFSLCFLFLSLVPAALPHLLPNSFTTSCSSTAVLFTFLFKANEDLLFTDGLACVCVSPVRRTKSLSNYLSEHPILPRDCISYKNSDILSPHLPLCCRPPFVLVLTHRTQPKTWRWPGWKVFTLQAQCPQHLPAVHEVPLLWPTAYSDLFLASFKVIPAFLTFVPTLCCILYYLPIVYFLGQLQLFWWAFNCFL